MAQNTIVSDTYRGVGDSIGRYSGILIPGIGGINRKTGNNTNAIRWARALRTVASLSNRLTLDIGMSLVLSCSYSRLILVLAAASSA